MVADAPPGAEHRGHGIEHRARNPVVASAHCARFRLPVRRRGADAHARRAGRGQGRGADASDGRRMSQWPFVIGAFSVAILAVAALVAWAFVTMRRAEAAAEALPRR